MSKLRSSNKSLVLRYNVLTDGGAVGFIPLAVFLPIGCVTKTCVIVPRTDFVSAGAAQIFIGWNAAPQRIVDQAQGTAGDYTDYNVGTFGFSIDAGVHRTGIASLQSLNATLATAQIGVTILVAALTAGEALFIIDYEEIVN